MLPELGMWCGDNSGVKWRPIRSVEDVKRNPPAKLCIIAEISFGDVYSIPLNRAEGQININLLWFGYDGIWFTPDEWMEISDCGW